MNLKDMQAKVEMQIMSYGGYWRPKSMISRLIEETGEFARAINIKYGDKLSKGANDGRDVSHELVDVLYTTLALSNIYKINLDDIKINQFSVDNNIDCLNLPCIISKKVGILSGLMIDIDTDNLSDMINKIIKEIVKDVLKISILLEVDLSIEFNNKVDADNVKMEKVYNK